MCGWSSIPPMWPSAHPVTGVFFFFTLRPPQLSYSLFGRPTSVCLKAMISTSMLRIDGKWWKCGFHQQDRGFAKLNTRTNGYSLKFKRECRISTMDSTLGCWENFGGNRQPNSNIQINHFVGVARLPGCPARNPPGILWLYKLALKSTFYRFLCENCNLGKYRISWFSDKSSNSSNVSSPFFIYPRRPRPSGINSRSDRICRTSSSTEASKVKVYP